MAKRKQRKARKVNPVAKALRTPALRPKVKKSGKRYDRKKEEQPFYMHGWTPGPWI